MTGDNKARRLNVHGTFDLVPSLLDALAGAGVDVSDDFVLVFDDSANAFVKVPISQLFLAAGYAPSTPGAFDNVVIGGVTPLAGSFTALHSTSEFVSTSSLAALGVDQSDAAAITTTFTLVTAADDAKGVKLPAAAAGRRVIVKNSVVDKILLLYPATGDGINAVAVNSPFSLGASLVVELIALDATTWYTLPLVAS